MVGPDTEQAASNALLAAMRVVGGDEGIGATGAAETAAPVERETAAGEEESWIVDDEDDADVVVVVVDVVE